MKRNKGIMYDDAMIEHFKKNPGELKGYLAVALEEYQADGNEKAFLTALSLAAKVKGGFLKLSKSTGLSRESLYKALSKNRDPRLSTVIEVVSSLGYSFKLA